MVIDCLILGPNRRDFRTELAAAEPLRNRSGAYDNLRLSSLPFDGQRQSYTDVFASLGEPAANVDVFHAPNWATHYLEHKLRAAELRAEQINYWSAEQPRARRLLALNPRVIAVTTTFATDANTVREVVAQAKALAPDALVVVGGPFVLSLTRRSPAEVQDMIFSMIGADVFVIEPQGETTLLRLTRRRVAGRDWRNLPNLVLKGASDQWQRTERAAEFNPVSDIDWSAFPPGRLGNTAFLRTARSCVYECAFCNFPELAGGLDLAPLEVLDAELRSLCNQGVKQVIFIDDTFNIPLPRFKAICRLIIDRGYPLQWYSMFRCGNSDREAFDLMAQSGCAGVFLGIESGSQTVLDAMRKVAKIERYLTGVAELKCRGIMTLGSYIVGFPPETRATVDETLAFIDRAGTDYYRAQLFYYDTATPISTKAADFGLRGGGYSWRHDGMTWQEGCDEIARIYQQVGNSVVAPANGFDLETIAYMIGNGWSNEGLRATVRHMSDLLRQSLGPCGASELQQGEQALRQAYAAYAPRRETAHAV